MTARSDERSAVDFLGDKVFDGGRIRIVMLAKDFSRVSPAISMSACRGGRPIVQALALPTQHGLKPRTTAMDIGPEFTAKALDP